MSGNARLTMEMSIATITRLRQQIVSTSSRRRRLSAGGCSARLASGAGLGFTQ
jgi:hypothetical protein